MIDWAGVRFVIAIVNRIWICCLLLELIYHNMILEMSPDSSLSLFSIDLDCWLSSPSGTSLKNKVYLNLTLDRNLGLIKCWSQGLLETWEEETLGCQSPSKHHQVWVVDPAPENRYLFIFLSHLFFYLKKRRSKNVSIQAAPSLGCWSSTWESSGKRCDISLMCGNGPYNVLATNALCVREIFQRLNT